MTSMQFVFMCVQVMIKKSFSIFYKSLNATGLSAQILTAIPVSSQPQVRTTFWNIVETE